LDITIAEGEMIGVVGVSGSGKSTLLNILGGLDRPTGGRAVVNGRDLGRLSQRGLDQYRRQTVGFVWQYGARNLIPYLTALENIQLPMTLSGKVGKKPRQRATELLNLVGLSERMEHRLEELSGGEQQRVAVAIALANQPHLLLADEPTGELDTATAKSIYDLFRDLNRKLGLTIVIVSHDSSIARHVDRVVAVRDGKLASETLRVKSSAGGGVLHDDKLHTFEELVILDSAGRLPLPREYLEHFHINRRVRLEINEDGILIRPPKPEHADSEHSNISPEATDVPKGIVDEQKGPAWLGRSKRLLKMLSAKLYFRLPARLKKPEDDNSEGEH
jgi:ABC-type lipoprotein export system ATPase subunit/bifunctional DNA-binding transcriptional regulator/antitoxin component of YhaV-PrlF toxin-antitoxin module